VVVVVADRMCRSQARRLGVVTRAVPMDLQPVVVSLAPPTRQRSAHVWLCAEVRTALAA